MAATYTHISRWGHQLDSRWRRYRCVLNFLHYRRYREWLAQPKSAIPADKPLVVFDFADTRIDGPQGRRFYHLFIYFVRAGYHPILRENYLALHNMAVRFKGYCQQEDFSVVARLEDIDRPYIRVTDWPTPKPRQLCQQTIRVDYTPGYSMGESVFPMPFPMFPAIYKHRQDLQLDAYRKQPRAWGIFFGGDGHGQKYNKASMAEVYGKISRAQVLAMLEQHTKAGQCWIPENQQVLDSALQTYFDGLVLVNTRRCKIAPERWLSAVARARFFVACPGVRYPMSHNLIEALAVGSVPILQYAELLFPALEHGKNCLVYRDEAELLLRIEQAQSIPEAEYQAMARAAVDYYEAYLAPGAVIGQLLARDSQSVTLRIMPSLKAGGGYL